MTLTITLGQVSRDVDTRVRRVEEPSSYCKPFDQRGIEVMLPTGHYVTVLWERG